MPARIAVVAGIRTPFCKAGGVFKDLRADDLGTIAVRELLARMTFDPRWVDEVILGNVLPPPNATNIARIIAVRAGLPESVPAYTVNRNCASGMEAVTSAADKILLGHADIIVAGGTESMSNFPVFFPNTMRTFLQQLGRSRGLANTARTVFSFRPSMLIPQVPELADPLCGLTMGQTAERIAREFKISRPEQDLFAFESQKRTFEATQKGYFKEEIVPVPLPPSYTKAQEVDDGVRANQTLESLEKLKPVFDPLTGTVTAGNSSQITDGAVALLLMSDTKANQLGLKPLGYLTGYAAAALDPSRMGLGPAYAISKLFKQNNIQLADIDLIEINEAFAGQVLAVVKALASDEFAKRALGRTKAIGEIDLTKLNVNGGAIALGHPLGASGARLILTLLLDLRRRKKKRGLASLCVGGGQGQACILEVPS